MLVLSRLASIVDHRTIHHGVPCTLLMSHGVCAPTRNCFMLKSGVAIPRFRGCWEEESEVRKTKKRQSVIHRNPKDKHGTAVGFDFLRSVSVFCINAERSSRAKTSTGKFLFLLLRFLGLLLLHFVTLFCCPSPRDLERGRAGSHLQMKMHTKNIKMHIKPEQSLAMLNDVSGCFFFRLRSLSC